MGCKPMSEQEKASVGVAAPTEAKGRDLRCSNSQCDFTTFQGTRQVFPYLLNGEDNAISARELARITGFSSTRVLRDAVERERRAGVLILSGDTGYYLPSTDEAQAEREIQSFVHRTDARMLSNRYSVRACKRWLKRCRRREIEGQRGLFDERGEST